MNKQVSPDYLFKRLGEQMIQLELLSEQLNAVRQKNNELEKKLLEKEEV